MIVLAPALELLAKAVGRSTPDLSEIATDRWIISPAEMRHVPPAHFLPNQLDRVRNVDFGTIGDVVRTLRGGFDAREEETIGYRLRDVDLIDGVLYCAGATRHLRARQRKAPAFRRPREATSGALYESWVGNRWFGNWLSNDCLTYPLAMDHAPTVTTMAVQSGHIADYESVLGIAPRRVTNIHFDELILFKDHGNNTGRQARATALRDRATAGVSFEEHPGVFLLRGSSGDRRLLHDETAIAERLNRDRGFRIIDPMQSTVRELIEACAGAKVVAGIEGSQLAHGLMVMPENAVLLVLQPPDRVISVLKSATDRQQQGFAFVVGHGTVEGFVVDYDEIIRTLDLAGC